MLVESLMTRDAESARPESTLAEAAAVMWRRDCGVVPVTDEGGRVVGVITDKDVMRCTASGLNPAESRVEQFMDGSYETVHVDADVETALDEVPATSEPPASGTMSATGTGPLGGLMGRRPIVVVDDQRRVVGLITRPHLAMDMAKLQSGQVVAGRAETMQLVWRCTDCGYLLTRAEQLPDECPDCGAPKEHFVLVTED